jgi:hypothetical protein
MLSKQSIRGTTKVFMNKELITDKEILIKESESWTEPQLNFFKKMIRQGGNFSIGGRKYFIIPNDSNKPVK